MGKKNHNSDTDTETTAADEQNIHNNNEEKLNSIGSATVNQHDDTSCSNSSRIEGANKPNSNNVNESKSSNCEEVKEPQFCVAPTKNEFKLRIVPIEKLLAKPPPPVREETPAPKLTVKAASDQVKRKSLPARCTRKNIPIIEFSDTESSSNEDIVTVNKKKIASKKVVVLSSDSSEDEVKVQRASKRSKTVTPRSSVSRTASPALARAAQLIKRESTSTSNNEDAPRRSPTSTHELSRPASPARTKNTDKRIRRFCVRVKRLSSSAINALTKPRQKAQALKMTSETSASTSKRDQVSSESDYSDEKEQNINISDDSASSDSSSASEVMPSRKARIFNKRASKSSNDDSDFEVQSKPAKKRRRVNTNSSDSDDDGDDEKAKNKRKHIRKIIKTKDLDISTKTATKEEEERRKRIEERQKLYNQIYEKPDSVEVTELVLDFDPETKEPLLEVDKGLLKKLKPHQVTGVRFMWDACFETLEDTREKPGSGCILAHCMGLGKTLQIVALAHTLLINSRKTNIERVLIISPLSTLNNWAREFKHWMSFARKRDIEIYDMSRFKDKALRTFKLNEWYEEGGVCILGYDMYRILANEKAKGLRKKQREQLQQALVDPGPDLVVCDEGHLLKNEKTSISKAVTKMRTRRRIVLTGTPLQNNLKEYYCMIQFIKPNLLGTYKEYLNRFVNPITNGQYTDSTERDIRLMKHRSHILHKMLEGCTQRRDYSVLSPYLPPKHEYVVYTTLSILQQLMYEYYMTIQRDITGSDLSGKGARLFQDFQDLRRIWTHPMNLRVNSDTVIRKRLLADNEDSLDEFICDDEDEDEELNGGDSSSDSSASVKSFASGGGGDKPTAKPRKTRNNKNANGEGSDPEEAVQPPPADDPSEWWKRFVADKELNNINHSPKLLILMKLLQQCEAIGDKLLVFSQSLQSLDVIEHFLKLIDQKTKGAEIEGDVADIKGLWANGRDYFRLDGSCSVESREAMCKKFNDPKNLRARLFLISTRAGGLGINLVAANRVVIFDVSWNPSHDTQSIFRVYRFGQEKPCYIYRLIAMGTMEQKVYERQVTKQATAKRVIDEQQISRHYNQSDLQELYTYELKPTTERELPVLPKDRLFAELLVEHADLLFKYHEHDSLLENEESENLSEEERKAAWNEYEAEKTRSVQTAQYISYDRNAFGAQFGNPSGSVTSNKIFGFRSDVLLRLLNMKVAKDFPELNPMQATQLVPKYLGDLYNQMNNSDPTMYKDLLELHQKLSHPSGMYMNPLLFANQQTSAAGYYQAPPAEPQPGMQPGMQPVMQPGMQPGMMPGMPPGMAPQGYGPPIGPPPGPPVASRFDPNQVYEID